MRLVVDVSLERRKRLRGDNWWFDGRGSLAGSRLLLPANPLGDHAVGELYQIAEKVRDLTEEKKLTLCIKAGKWNKELSEHLFVAENRQIIVLKLNGVVEGEQTVVTWLVKVVLVWNKRENWLVGRYYHLPFLKSTLQTSVHFFV